MTTKSIHTFHIPVMGLSYTIDSPIRVAKYGISSVISIVDDELIEKMNAFYSAKYHFPYNKITPTVDDFRAKRITSYLNLVDLIVQKELAKFKVELVENEQSLFNYIELLPNQSEIKNKFQRLLQEGFHLKNTVKDYVEKYVLAGAIDVNIMTKLDKDNFIKGKALPISFNDAHAALRGFANSTLTSSVIVSAGMNPRLYSYFENFSAFFPDENGNLKKKVTLKVSDFRSAMIQGAFLAKKGIWVSEYRIESGLNCGGHAFATDGLLLGPILEEFKTKKQELVASAHNLMVKALEQKKLPIPREPLPLKITVQGGVGTAEEHHFLLHQYAVDAVGWGSPFLLVPEATSVDNETRKLLAAATEDDLYLSHISPLGVPFNTLRGTSNERIKQKRIDENKAGSSCPKKYLALQKDAEGNGICTASKKFQDEKLHELEDKKETLSEADYNKEKHRITEKSCLCVGLANASYLENHIEIKGQNQGVVVCPGPNMAYFNQEVSLSKMVQHIYGNTSILSNINRPNVFVKELKIYLDYFKNELDELNEMTASQLKKWHTFKKNLLEGIDYYQIKFSSGSYFQNGLKDIKEKLDFYKAELNAITFSEFELS